MSAMSDFEMSTDKIICFRCGETFTKYKNNFWVCYGDLYKAVGYMPYCKECVTTMYNRYVRQCKDPKKALRQLCRKLDLFWSEKVYDSLKEKSVPKTLLSNYISSINRSSGTGKCYDDTLKTEDTLWNNLFPPEVTDIEIPFGDVDTVANNSTDREDISIDIPDDVKEAWGTGYTDAMYKELEQRRIYWMERLPDEFNTGIGSDAIIRQICALELDINRDRAAGKNVTQMVTGLSGLIGSLNLKPTQIKQDEMDSAYTKTPLGVWLWKYEMERPLPETHDENIIRKNVFTWMGHVCKMLGKKNAYTKLYEDEIAKYRVNKPEYDDEDDEAFMLDLMEDSSDMED